ncbi:MAG: biotin/lipoyl-binding protein, partial [Caulobacteraceae bacterium]
MPDILMPALSPTMEEGTLAKWHVKPGDSVKSGDVIADIETDKATMEVEAVDEGEIGELLVEEGAQGVKVGTPIAKMAGEGGEAGASTEAPPATAPQAEEQTSQAPAPAQDEAPPPPAAAEPAPAEQPAKLDASAAKADAPDAKPAEPEKAGDP